MTDNTPAASSAAPDPASEKSPNSPLAGAKKRTVFAWSLWDWGSASFNAVVTTFVFSRYITSESFGSEQSTSVALGTATTIAGIIVALLAPVIGRLADGTGRRKAWLGVNTLIVVVAIALLAFVAPSERYLAFGLIVLAIGNVAFEFASVSYNAMLNQISHNGNVGKISGFGWGMGYIGGIVLLLILFFGFISPEVGWFGVTSENGWDVRLSMLIAAIWFAIFAVPVMLAVPEVPRPAVTKSLGRQVLTAYADLFRSIADLWKNARSTLHFLIASAVFRDGLTGVFTFGAVIAGQSFGFDQDVVLIFGIAANVVAGAATIAVGAIEDRIGAKRLMSGSILLMVICGLVVFILNSLGAWVFWLFGLALCLFVGPVQSASRSYLARLIPAGREGEIFGLYATTGRAVSFLAPAAFTVSVSLGGSTIFGILGIVLVLLIGLGLLALVRTPKATTTAGAA